MYGENGVKKMLTKSSKWSLNFLREDCDEEVEQHDVADEQVDGEEERNDVIVVGQVVNIRLVAVTGSDVTVVEVVNDADVAACDEISAAEHLEAIGRVPDLDAEVIV